MLTLTLRNLERDGLIARELFPEVPPRVEYELTGLGKSLLAPTQALLDWVGNTGRKSEKRAASLTKEGLSEVRKPTVSIFLKPSIRKKQFLSQIKLREGSPRELTGPKRLLCVELFAEVVRIPGRTNAASVRDSQNRSSWQFPRRRSGQPPSSAAQIPRAAAQLPLRVTAPFPP